MPVNQSNGIEHPLTWQAILWRLLLTGLLILALAGPGLTLFNTVTNLPDTHVLPETELVTRP